MKRLIISMVLCLFAATASFAQKFIVRGRVTDAKTGEILQDANILERKSGTGVATNAYGFYSILLSKGECILQCSMLGYVTRRDTLNLKGNEVLNLSLTPGDYHLKDIEVVGARRHSGQFTLNAKEIQAIPVAGGEPDLIRSLQFLPGVQSGNEGTNNISVRGSGQWGNLVLLDEAVIYNPNHALSFFSVFNNDAISKVNFYKSYFPLKYGGRSSSVIDVRMRDGNSKERQRTASIGLIASKVLLEGPLEKGSYLVSGRFGYPGPVVSLLAGDLTSKPQMLFYDLNGKLNLNLNERNKLFFSLYTGGDHTLFNKLVKGYGMDWGNATATVRWNHILNNRTNVNTSAIFSNYYYSYKSLSDGLRYVWKSNMQSYQLKSDWETYLNSLFTLKWGVSGHYFTTMPGSIGKSGKDSNVIPSRMPQKGLWDMALYAETDFWLLSELRLNAGLRMSLLHAPASSYYNTKTYVIPEPRAELSYMLHSSHRFSLSYTQAAQGLHMLTTSSVGIPSDLWMPANALLKPSVMRQVAVGYEYNFPQKNYTLSIEGYVRRTNHVVDYKENADVFQNDQIENEVETGFVKSCGVEFSFSKNHGPLTGWLSYTLSKARNHIGGSVYKPVYDRPHNLKFFLSWEVSKHWLLSSTFSYASGMNITAPVGKYSSENMVVYIYTDRNGYRAPAFHELDFSATWRIKRNRSWTLSLINVYNRKNVFSIYAGRYKHSADYARIYKLYLYGIVPSLTYTFTF